MKIVTYLLLIAALLSNAVCAQKISADKIPAAVSSAFITKFPIATKTIWEIENENEYEAEFKINEASKIQSVKNGNCFEAEIQKGEEIFDVLFTADGKVLSKTKMEKEKEDKD